jgi:hypothetical protein
MSEETINKFEESFIQKRYKEYTSTGTHRIMLATIIKQCLKPFA